MGNARADSAQIRMRLPVLTALGAVVAADALARKDIDEAMALRDLAAGSGLSEAMVFRTAMQPLEGTFAILDLEASDREVNSLHRSRQRNFYGLGGSAQIGRDVSHKFLRIGIRSSVFDDAQMMMPAALLGPDDVAIAFSHSGSTSAVLNAVEPARKTGARTMRPVQAKRKL